MPGGLRSPRYGHGDWNDSLQPADPEPRGVACAAPGRSRCTWHALRTLAAALRGMRVTAAEGAIVGGLREGIGQPGSGEGMREHLLFATVLRPATPSVIRRR